MARVLSTIAALTFLAALPSTPASAKILRPESAIVDKTICWWSGSDSEQYHRDHSYIYAYHYHDWPAIQWVVRGIWSMGSDGAITLKLEGGTVMVRQYDVMGDRIDELTGSLNGGRDGYFC